MDEQPSVDAPDGGGERARLEEALATVAHQRDLERAAARAASERAEELRSRTAAVERERDAEREALRRERSAERREHERALARAQDDATRSRHAVERAERARDGAERRLAGSERKRERVERQLALMRRRAERLERSLTAIRSGRAYAAMRLLWRLRRPFSRAAGAGGEPDPAVDDGPTDGGGARPQPHRDRDPDPYPAPSRPPSADARGTGSSPAPRGPSTAAPERAGSRPTVAAVLDEMSAACFAPECDLMPLTLDGWREQLDERRPDLLLVESAWQGNGGEWQHQIASYARADLAGHPRLRALVDACRERGIPTAFWNKEDPVHFDRFAEAAALFDHVFTTDARCVERYRGLPGRRTVAALPFAAQPLIHNPSLAVEARSAAPCFAGAWYRDRHADRRTALEALLDAARPFGLVIYDRTFGSSDPAFGFPDRFQPHVLGRLTYDRVLEVYKSHRVFLNANSVVDSPTMCSRRVLELAASDTAILSTPAAALSSLLGDAVVEAGDHASATAGLELLLGDAGERRLRTRAARRAVFAAHTYAHRLAAIAAAAGLELDAGERSALAALVAVERRQDARDAVRAIAAQTRPPRELVLGMRPGASVNVEALSDELPDTSVRAIDVPSDADDRIAPLAAAASAPWVLALRPDAPLAAHAVEDLAAAAGFAAADVIGPPAGDGPAGEHRRAESVDARAALVRRELAAERGWPGGDAEQASDALRGWADDGIAIYACDGDLLAAEPHGRGGAAAGRAAP